MASPQPIVVLDPLPWTRSTVMEFALHELVNGGQLAPNVELHNFAPNAIS
jgi:hypothetical protein